jgi:hypothetical protein
MSDVDREIWLAAACVISWLVQENKRLGELAGEWEERWKAERADHESTIKTWNESARDSYE